MKNVKLRAFFAYGIMLAVLFGACVDPVSIPEGGQVLPAAAGRDSTEPRPVEVEIAVYRSEAARRNAASSLPDTRAAAGAGRDDIYLGGQLNFSQLIVVDNSGNIVMFFENEDSYALFVPPGETVNYNFLLLKGYREDSGPPTLLTAGYTPKTIKAQDGNFVVTITLWPLLIDTEFVTADGYVPEANRTVQPPLPAGSSAAKLLPVEWALNWRIKAATTGGVDSSNGLLILKSAQNKNNPLFLKARGIINKNDGSTTTINYPLPGGGLPENMTVDPDNAKITLDIFGEKETVPKIETAGSANFNLEYVPFSMAFKDAWIGHSSVIASGDGFPVWIIRNGTNDLAQNANTNFDLRTGASEKNGNGAVRFEVKANKPRPDGTSDLSLSEGYLNDTSLQIMFSDKGYTGNADLYYAAVEAGTAPPADDYSSYKFLETLTGPQTQRETSLPDTERTNIQDKDFYIILTQGGNISNALKLERGIYVGIEEGASDNEDDVEDATNGRGDVSEGGVVGG